MATAITLLALATRTTTTITETHGNVICQPYQANGDVVGNAIDLDAGSSERAISLALTWEDVSPDNSYQPAIVVRIEASEDAVTWTAIPDRFDQVNLGCVRGPGGEVLPSGVQRLGFTSPSRYIRAHATIFARGAQAPGLARFSVTGQKA